LGCSGRVSSSCSTRDTRRVTVKLDVYIFITILIQAVSIIENKYLKKKSTLGTGDFPKKGFYLKFSVFSSM
jgi:hypothetical protein